MSDTAAAQLRRLLLVIPHLADGEEHRVEDVAAAVGTDAATLLRDLRAIVSRAGDPGGFVEGVQLYLTGDRVALHSKTFLRPMRLTISELRALELGLAMLAAERPPDERPLFERARDRLRRLLAQPPAAALDADAPAPDAEPPRTMRVRYSARVARGIAEREGITPNPDGSLTMSYPLADPQWAVRHVLQYGPNAEILEPAELRAEVARRLLGMVSV